MTNDELEEAIGQREAVEKGLPDDVVNAQLAAYTRQEKVQYLAEKTADTTHAESLSDEELESAVVQNLVYNNSEAARRKNVAAASKSENIEYLIGALSEPEILKIEPATPRKICAAEMGLSETDVVKKVVKFTDKYGYPRLNDEIAKLRAPVSAPVP